MKKRPNILFLYSDQHNARCLSSAGHPEIQTPNLDKLAYTGMRFANAYTQNPVCTPSRMSMLSSLYPSTFAYYGLYGNEPESRMSNIFSYLKENGYRTGAIGKLHTPRYWIERDCQYVYDEFLEYPKYLEALNLYEKNDGRNFSGDKDMYSTDTSNIPLEHSVEVVTAKETVRFINNEGEPKDRGENKEPWFAWVTFSRPHEPCIPSAPFDEMYDPDELSLPPVDIQPNNKRISNKRPGIDIEENDLRDWLSAYYGLVSQVDYAIGKIIKELELSGQLDNTIIIYSSDHGDYAGEHSRMEKVSGISYRAITRVPLIIRTPEMSKRGEVYDGIVESVDIFPTICELIDIDVISTAQGKSLAGVLEDPELKIKESALTENAYRKALATEKFRYVANLESEDEEDELYDLENDRWELENRINDPEYKEIAQEMQRKLLDRLVKARRPVTVMNGGWHNHKYDRDGRLNINECNDITPYW